MPETRPPPVYTGLVVHRDPRNRYSMLVNHEWQKVDLAEGDVTGAMFLPNPEDQATYFAVEARRLEFKIKPKDLAALRNGFYEGIAGLAGSVVESKEAEAIGDLITISARHTYREGDAVRKRWVRLLYRERTQARIVAQGSTPEEFDYWESMFGYSIHSFRFGDWWSEVTGVEWTDSLVAPED